MQLISRCQPPSEQDPLAEAPNRQHFGLFCFLKQTRLPGVEGRQSSPPTLRCPSKTLLPLEKPLAGSSAHPPAQAQDHEAAGIRDPLAITADPVPSSGSSPCAPPQPLPTTSTFPKGTNSQNQPVRSNHHPQRDFGQGWG